MQGSGNFSVTGRLWLRHALVVGQVVSCVILLVLSSLLLRSLMRATAMDPGFDTERAAVASVWVDSARYLSDGGLPLGEQLVDRVRRIAGVQSASVCQHASAGDRRERHSVARRRGECEYGWRADVCEQRRGGLFRHTWHPVHTRPRLQRQRPARRATRRDRDRGVRAGVFGRASALGKRVRQSEREPYVEIVGVVRDHMYGSYGDLTTPIFYTSYTQQPRVSTQVRPVILVVRSTGSPAALVRDPNGDHRSGCHGLGRCADAARGDRIRAESPWLWHPPADDRRRIRVAAGDDRPLRHDGVRRHHAHTGDRDAYGDRRELDTDSA